MPPGCCWLGSEGGVHRLLPELLPCLSLFIVTRNRPPSQGDAGEGADEESLKEELAKATEQLKDTREKVGQGQD